MYLPKDLKRLISEFIIPKKTIMCDYGCVGFNVPATCSYILNRKIYKTGKIFYCCEICDIEEEDWVGYEYVHLDLEKDILLVDFIDK